MFACRLSQSSVPNRQQLCNSPSNRLQGERVRPGARIPAPEQLPNERQRNTLGGYGGGPLGDDFSFAQ
jgi:hypothetical protein